MTLPRLNPRAWYAVFGAAAVVLGTGTVAWASAGADDRPSVTEIETYCDVEERGAHQLAEELRRRARELDSRESAIAGQESEMATAEARLQARLDALDATRAELTALLGTADAERDARIDGIVKMVEAGRPSNVAPMFAQLDIDLAVTVLNRMNRKKAGKLLTALDPSKAAALAEKMAEPIHVEIP